MSLFFCGQILRVFSVLSIVSVLGACSLIKGPDQTLQARVEFHMGAAQSAAWSATIHLPQSSATRLFIERDDDTSRLSLIRDGKPVFQDEGAGLVAQALCYEPNLARPALLYSSGMYGVGLDLLTMLVLSGEDVELLPESATQVVTQLPAYSLPLSYREVDSPDGLGTYELMDLPLSCQSGQVSLLTEMTSGQGVELCRCDTGSLFQDLPLQAQLMRFVPQGLDGEFTPAFTEFELGGATLSQQLKPMTLDSEAFEALLRQLEDHGGGFNLQRFEHRAGTLVTVTSVNRALYEQFELTFLRGADKQWYLLQQVRPSSKAFNSIESVSLGQRGFTVQMCVEDCSWWGRYQPVEIDLLGARIKRIPSI